jgi:hypothetical protein
MHSRHEPDADADAQPLLSPATQIIESSDDYLGEGQTDLGRRVAPDKVELFAAADAATAVAEQLARQHCEFLALHDVGASGGLRLLASIAAALRTPVQQLAIRRQGQGVPLATVRFVEIPGRQNRTLRVYSTDIDADMQARRQLATLLVGHARLAALLVGQLPAHVLTSHLQPLRLAIRSGPWRNRVLLMIPSGANADLAAQAAALSTDHGPQVTVTAPATGLNQAWSLVAGAWNQMREGRRPGRGNEAAAVATGNPAAPATGAAAAEAAAPAAAAASADAPTGAAPAAAAPSAVATDARTKDIATVGVPPAPAAAPAQTPVPATPAPVVNAASAGPSASPAVTAVDASVVSAPHLGPPAPATRRPANDPLWARYLEACSEIKGLISACLMDVHGGHLLAHAGARPEPGPLVEQGLALYGAIARCGMALGLGASQPDAAIALTAHHLMLHPLPGHPGTVMHAVLDGSITNLTLARVQLQRVDATVLGVKPAH